MTIEPSTDEASSARFFADALASHRAGDLEAAVTAYRAALAARPDHADAIANLGVALRAQGNNEAAVEVMLDGVGRCPEAPELRYNLANGLRDAGRGEDAVEHYRAALSLDPGHAGAAANLGLVLKALGRGKEAIDHYRQAVARHPLSAELFNNLGTALWDRRQAEAAAACFRRAAAIRPDFPAALANLGLAINLLGDHEAAAQCYRRALAAEPHFAQAHAGLGQSLVSLGQSLVSLGRLDEALACFEAALAQDGHEIDALLGRARALLLAGRLAEGWVEYGARRKRPGAWAPSYACPQWDGGPLEDRTTLLHGEQGYADILQFVRYAPLVAARGGRVMVLCPRPLARLVATADGVDEVAVAGKRPPGFDLHHPLMDLPTVFGTVLDTIPAAVPYLRAPGEAGPRAPGFHVGIAWRGNPRHENDRNRSCPLERFLDLLEVPGVTLHSLQVGEAAGDIAALGAVALIADRGSGLGDFADTAAVVRDLDLVVSVDTALVHLAGALGRPVWTLLPHAPDWRWMLVRDDSPWYPTMRLFRQPSPGDWEGAFAAVVTALHEMLRDAASGGSSA